MVARACGITSQAVSQWKKVPLDHCPAIETATDGRLTCEQMRPDVQWQRDPATGRVNGYSVSISAAAGYTRAEPTPGSQARYAPPTAEAA